MKNVCLGLFGPGLFLVAVVFSGLGICPSWLLGLAFLSLSLSIGWSSCAWLCKTLAGWVILGFGIGLCLFFFSPEGRWDGENDDGLYANYATHLARTGQLVVEAGAYDGLDGDLLRRVCARRPLQAQPAGESLTSWYGPSAGEFFLNQAAFHEDTARVMGIGMQFPAGQAVFLAGAHTTFGVLALANWIALLGVGGLLGHFASRMGGRPIGYTMFLVWLLNPLAVWQANTHYAELLVAVSWLAAMAGARDSRLKPGMRGWCVALWCGVAACTKVEGLFLALGTMLGVLLMPKQSRKVAQAIGVAGVALSGAVMLAYGKIAGQNLIDTLLSFVGAPSNVFWFCLLLAAMACMLRRWWRCVPRWLDWSLAFGCALLFVWLWWIRPIVEQEHSFFYWPSQGEILSWRAFTLQRLGWYLQPWGLGLLLLGVCLFIARGTWRTHWATVVLVGGGLGFFLLYCYDIRNNPLQPYAMRRFVAAALPVVLFMSIVGWLGKPQTPMMRCLGAVAAGFICLGQALGLFWLRESRPQDNDRFPHDVVRIAREAPEGVLLVPAEHGLRGLATPLRLLGMREVIHLPQSTQRGWMLIREVAQQLNSSGRRAWIMAHVPVGREYESMENVFPLAASYRKHEAERRPYGTLEQVTSVGFFPVEPSFHPADIGQAINAHLEDFEEEQ